MEYKCNIINTVQLTGKIDNEEYVIEAGSEMTVNSQSIDRKKWFVYIPSISKYSYLEKYCFDYLIDKYIKYPKYYGEFQLPVISENGLSFTCITPSGYVIWVSKGDVVDEKYYGEIQRINSDEIKFR